MTTYNYWCQNCNCGAEPKDKNFQIELEDGEEKEPIYCVNTVEIGLEEDDLSGTEDEPGLLKLMGHQTNGFLRYTGKLMTKEQKSAVLKKRSSAHYNKEIKERRHEMWRNTFGRGTEK